MSERHIEISGDLFRELLIRPPGKNLHLVVDHG
jgi:hypothetical protein